MNSSFLSRRVLVTITSFTLGFTSSRSTRDFKDMAIASAPLSIAVLETTPINPTSPPPNTTLIPFFAINSAIFLAS